MYEGYVKMTVSFLVYRGKRGCGYIQTGTAFGRCRMRQTTFLSENRRKKIAGGLLLAAAFALQIVPRLFPSFADWYSGNIYPFLQGSVGRAAGWFPFSVSEVLLYLLAAVATVSGSLQAVKALKNKESAGFCRWAWSIFLAAGVLYFLYVVNCGINYQKESFADSAGMKVTEYSVEDLKETCVWLTGEVNRLSGSVERDGAGVMRLTENRKNGEENTMKRMKDLSEGPAEQAVNAMQKLGGSYPSLSGYYPRPKALLNPWLLSVQNLTGIYSPFTIEANYNSAMTDYNIPFTMCHELSHLKGFMQEEEANFIAFLACISSEEEEFQYSGNLMGWIYCMNVLYKVDYHEWEEVRATLADAVEADLDANREFWNRYDTVAAEVSNKVNDTYLKANGQDDGVQSYDRMTDLVVTYRKNMV